MQPAIDNYYQVLGVSETSTLAEIKSVYRKKALLLHPDRNDSPTAHNDFVLLTEAYEYLTKLKSGRSSTVNDNWHATDREYARQRAAEYAQMKHEEFINSDYYKTTEAFTVIIEHLLFVFAILLVVGAPLGGYLVAKIPGLCVGLLVVLLASRGWVNILFLNRPQIHLSSITNAIAYVWQKPAFIFAIMVPFNVLLLFTITLNTQLATSVIFVVFILAGISGWIITAFIPNSLKYFSRPVISGCIAPFVVNLFFLINYAFATGPLTETYKFQHQMEWYENNNGHSGGGYRKTSYIHLEGKKYEENHWFRMFADFDTMKDATTITYTFENGLFGLRVMKSYKFK